MRLDLGLSADFSGDANLALLATHRMTWLNVLGAEFRTDVQLGFNSNLHVEFYQPFNVQGTYFVAPRIGIGSEQRNVYQGNDRVAVYDVASRVAAIDIGMNFHKYGELRLGIEGGQVRPRLDTGPASLDPGDVTYREGAVRARLFLDRLDNVNFPRDGWRFGVEALDSQRALGADREYSKWRSTGEYVQSFGEITLRFSVAAGGKLGNNPLPGWDQFQWGGFLRQSGYATGQLTSSSLQFGQLIAQRLIFRSGFFAGA